MNLIQKLLLPKVAGPITAIILMLLAVSVWVQSSRIQSLTEQLKSCKNEKALVLSAADDLSESNVQKDAIIRKQTASIKALKEKSDVAKAAYQERLEAGRSAAAAYRVLGNDLLKLDAGTTEELGLCRAARDLLEQELIND